MSLPGTAAPDRNVQLVLPLIVLTVVIGTALLLYSFILADKERRIFGSRLISAEQWQQCRCSQRHHVTSPTAARRSWLVG